MQCVGRNRKIGRFWKGGKRFRNSLLKIVKGKDAQTRGIVWVCSSVRREDTGTDGPAWLCAAASLEARGRSQPEKER